MKTTTLLRVLMYVSVILAVVLVLYVCFVLPPLEPVPRWIKWTMPALFATAILIAMADLTWFYNPHE